MDSGRCDRTPAIYRVSEPILFEGAPRPFHCQIGWGNELLRVCETRCPKCGKAAREERGHLRCENCGIVEACCEGLHNPVQADRAVVEVIEAGDFEPGALPKTG